MTASRVSHPTSSNGWVPSFVKNRLTLSPLLRRSRSFVATDGPLSVPGKEPRAWNYADVILPRGEGPVKSLRTHPVGFPTPQNHNILWQRCIPIVARACGGYPEGRTVSS